MSPPDPQPARHAGYHDGLNHHLTTTDPPETATDSADQLALRSLPAPQLVESRHR